MPRSVADRICIRFHEVAVFNLARCPCLAGNVSGIIASRSLKLHDIVSLFQGKTNFMSQYRRRQLFFQQVEFKQSALAQLVVSALALAGKLLLTIDRTIWKRRGNTVNILVLAVCVGDVATPLLWHGLGGDDHAIEL